MDTTTTMLIGGLQFPMSPVWHDGSIWFSDQFSRRIYRAGLDGTCTPVAYVPGQPSGIAVRSDGTLLVVSMFDDLLLGYDGTRLRKIANLGGLRDGQSNDIVTDSANRAYVSGHGFDLFYAQTLDAPETAVLMVDAHDQVTVAATGLKMPNGLALDQSARRLFVAETAANRVAVFDVGAKGELEPAGVFVDLGERTPDGITLDGEGRLWVACPPQHEYVCVDPSGQITAMLPTRGRRAIGCTVGGEDGTTLILTTAHTTLEGYFDGTAIGALEVAAIG